MSTWPSLRLRIPEGYPVSLRNLIRYFRSDGLGTGIRYLSRRPESNHLLDERRPPYDLADLTCSEDLHCRLSDISLAKFRSCLATRVRPGRDFKPHACGSAAVGRSFLSAPSRSTIHKQLGRGLTLLASCLGCGSAPSDPRHTPFIGNPGIRKSVKIRKIGKAYSNRPTSNHRLGARATTAIQDAEKPVRSPPRVSGNQPRQAKTCTHVPPLFDRHLFSPRHTEHLKSGEAIR